MKLSGPKILLHIEGAVVFVAACAFYRKIGAPWLSFAILFLAPDLAMAGYLLGKNHGSVIYNSVHTYAGPFLLWVLAYFANQSSLLPLCLIWVAHIGIDRFLGYGLKSPTDFKDTHLNRV